jgi:hypothetical protein
MRRAILRTVACCLILDAVHTPSFAGDNENITIHHSLYEVKFRLAGYLGKAAAVCDEEDITIDAKASFALIDGEDMTYMYNHNKICGQWVSDGVDAFDRDSRSLGMISVCRNAKDAAETALELISRQHKDTQR